MAEAEEQLAEMGGLKLAALAGLGEVASRLIARIDTSISSTIPPALNHLLARSSGKDQ